MWSCIFLLPSRWIARQMFARWPWRRRRRAIGGICAFEIHRVLMFHARVFAPVVGDHTAQLSSPLGEGPVRLRDHAGPAISFADGKSVT